LAIKAYLSTCKDRFFGGGFTAEQNNSTLSTYYLFLQVEKQKIIKGSAGKLLSQTNGEDVRSEALSAAKVKATDDSIAPTSDSSKDSFKRNSNTLQGQSKAPLNLSGKDPTPAKKHSGRATNFFER
jgi:chromosome transmission fidelity protein 18